MADTMNFGPEWLRALSDGPQSGGSAAAPSTKFKLAEHRYGREEMLTLYQDHYEVPPGLHKFPNIFVQQTQKPIALMPLSDDEQRLIAQGVNSQVVMRPVRGAQPATRGGRGGPMVDRGRARGTGRGQGGVYSRGSLENGDMGGGFGRPRGPNKDGWEEVGSRKVERGYTRPFDDLGREGHSGHAGHPRFSRSMSDNWREKGGPGEEEEEGDWRRPAPRGERWSTRSNWREAGRGGHDLDRRDGGFSRRGGFDSEDRGRRMGEPRDSEDVPEWIDDGTEDVGSFDASGAFVSTREQPYLRDKREEKDHIQASGDPPHMDQDSRRDGLAPQREEQDDWESNDTQDVHSTSNSDNRERGPARLQTGKDDPAQGPFRERGPSRSLTNKDDTVQGTFRERGPARLPASKDDPIQTPCVEEESPMPNGVVGSAPVVAGGTVLSSSSSNSSVPAGTSEVAAAVSSVVAAEEEREPPQEAVPVVPMSHENALKWYYVDPQKKLQGPFPSDDMANWFSAGYFTMALEVKRGCDHDFQPLGDLMRQWGHIPFVPGPVHPPFVKPKTAAKPPEASLTTPTPVPTTPTTPIHPAGPLSFPAAANPSQAPNPAQAPNPSQAPKPSQAPNAGQVPSQGLVASLLDQMGGPGAIDAESLMLHQQIFMQHNILTTQMELRQMQVQIMNQVQEQDSYKALDATQQQQLMMSYMQSSPALQALVHKLQQLQQLQAQMQLLAQHAPTLPGVTAGSLPGVQGSLPTVPGVTAASVPSLPVPQQQQQQQKSLLSGVENLTGSSSPPFSLPATPATSVGEGQGQGIGQGQGDIPSIWGSGPPAAAWSQGQPTSVWELENTAPPATVEQIRKEREEIARLMQDMERKREEDKQRAQEELQRKEEELRLARQAVEREKEELERTKILERQRLEELQRQQEEEQRRREAEEAQRRKREEEEELRRKELEEAQRRKMEEEQRKREAEEQRRRKEEEERLRQEEEERRREEGKRRKEEEKRKAEEEEWRKQEEVRRKREAEELALQELRRMEEARQQQEADRQRQRELEKQQEAEAAQKKKDLEKQQQDALRRMQQQQALQNIQLPSSANWARQQQQGGQSVQSRSLADIQQDEERQLKYERERQQIQRQLEEQQQLQQQQQQPQKTWASNLAAQQPPAVKLTEIQNEQASQQRKEKQKTQQQQQYQAKTMSLSQAAAWGAGTSSLFNNAHTQPSSSSSAAAAGANAWSGGTSSIWGAPSSNSSSSSSPAAIWGNGTSSAPAQKGPSSKKSQNSSGGQASSEFPSLHNPKSNKSKQSAPKTSANSSVPTSKSKKDEEAVQRLFKEKEQTKDDFTMWCETFLGDMDVQVDIETFVSFLREVDSPYEVHDYVKSYLGESRKAREFGKQFLERRSQFNNKARKERQQEEESIWGPAPAVNPREIRGTAVLTSNADSGGFTEVGGSKSKGAKKKKKMQKLDGSALLGFTVAKDPNRKNAGEIESAD